jgi:hypothetical protein
MIEIQIKIKNEWYCLKWDDSIKSDLKKISVIQQGFARWKNHLNLDLWFRNMQQCFESIPDDVFSKNLEKIWQNEIDFILNYLNYNDKLSYSKKYLEIGSGLSILGLLLSQVYSEIDFYFVDNDYVENLKNAPFYNDQHHAFYNNFDVIKNCIKSSNIDVSRIHLLKPDSPWPANLDVVTSMMSYCWHYGADNYLQKIESNLNNDGHLILDVLHVSDNLEKIISKFNQPILKFSYTNKKNLLENAKYGIFDRSMLNLNSLNSHGGRYLWIKKN